MVSYQEDNIIMVYCPALKLRPKCILRCVDTFSLYHVNLSPFKLNLATANFTEQK